MIFQRILNGYLDAIDFTDCGPDDGGRADAPWSESLFIVTESHVVEFLSLAPADLLDGIEPEQIGHDIWLTRCGHGAGFWDRDLGDRGDRLSDICNRMGEVYTYVSDDGELHMC